VVGPTTTELESLNELIKFDHIYYKIEPADESSKCASDTINSHGGTINIHITQDSKDSDDCVVVKEESVKTEKASNEVSLDSSDSTAMAGESEENLLPSNLLDDIESLLAGDYLGFSAVGDENTAEIISGEGHQIVKTDSSETIVSSPKRGTKRRLSDLIPDIVPSPGSPDSLCGDSGFISDSSMMDSVASPCSSDDSGMLTEDPWEESFMQLFPSLV